jgi:outer membrane lipoprotein-sorting protein
MITLCSCGERSRHDVYEGIYKRYTNLDSFYAEVKVTVQDDKQKSEYMARQFYKGPDSFALFIDSPEVVSGSGYTAKAGRYLLKSGFGHEMQASVAFPDERNFIFICDFFEEYYKSEESFAQTTGGPLDNTTVLTCYLSGKSPKRFMQSLKIDNKTYLPLELTTYDIDKKPVVEVRFGEFKRNCEIDERIFD